MTKNELNQRSEKLLGSCELKRCSIKNIFAQSHPILRPRSRRTKR